MSALQPPRGTHDIYGDQAQKMRYISDSLARIAGSFGYGEIHTPIFEFTEVFKRSIGDTTDIVSKEMYTFQDRGGEEITLRPENTAGVVRALVSNGLAQSLPLKLFYFGPMFRYERPQKGRYRQFHQGGAEFLGAKGPMSDVETIAMAAEFLDSIGVLRKTNLEINTIGDPESRLAYRQALVDYFSQYSNDLSEDSKIRLEKNPLRILDSKDPNDRKLIESAPMFHDSLNDLSRDYFDRVQDGLSKLGMAFTVSQRLVRGLDYYTHTVFEFVTDQLGAQSAVLAGGRYDGLVSQMGGPETPAVGWASGIERLSLLLDSWPQPPRPIMVLALGDEDAAYAMTVAHQLRHKGRHVLVEIDGNLKKKFSKAVKANASHALMVGGDEWAKGEIVVKDLDASTQKNIPIQDLLNEF